MVKEEEISIIKTIQEMVKEGESEEKIIQTLKDLGVEANQAKRLLLLGQADTFALLRNEISKIVLADFDKEKPKFIDFLKDESKKIDEKLKQTLAKDIDYSIEQYKKELNKTLVNFEEKIKGISDVSDRVKANLNELGSKIALLEQDLAETKVKGIGTKSRLISMLLLALGILFCVSSLYLFFINFQGTLSIDSVIITIVIALTGITMLFTSTLL